MHVNLSLMLPLDQAQQLKNLTEALHQIARHINERGEQSEAAQIDVRKITPTNVVRAVLARALDQMTAAERHALISVVMADGVVAGRPRSAA